MKRQRPGLGPRVMEWSSTTSSGTEVRGDVDGEITGKYVFVGELGVL